MGKNRVTYPHTHKNQASPTVLHNQNQSVSTKIYSWWVCIRRSSGEAKSTCHSSAEAETVVVEAARKTARKTSRIRIWKELCGFSPPLNWKHNLRLLRSCGPWVQRFSGPLVCRPFGPLSWSFEMLCVSEFTDAAVQKLQRWEIVGLWWFQILQIPYAYRSREYPAKWRNCLLQMPETGRKYHSN